MSHRGHFYKPNASPGTGRKQRVAAYLDGIAGRHGKLFTNAIPMGTHLRRHPCASPRLEHDSDFSVWMQAGWIARLHLSAGLVSRLVAKSARTSFFM